MDELIAAIEQALAKKGLSASAASQLAVGNPSLIKNLKNRKTDRERSHPFENLQALADILDLEFYFGPQRPAPGPRGFAEAAQKVLDPSLDGKPEALRQGFLPIPYHRADRAHHGSSHIALAKSWLIDQGLSLDNMFAITMPNDDMAPSIPQGELLFIDESIEVGPEPTLFAMTIDGHLRVGWLTLPKAACLAVFFERKYSVPVARHGTKGPSIEPIGCVVSRFDDLPRPWIDADVKKDMYAIAKKMVSG